MKRTFLSAIFVLLLCMSLAISAFAASDTVFLYDEAGLLTSSEESRLADQLQDVSDAYSAQILIVTLPSLDGLDADDYVEYLYDAMDFGYGAKRDGVLLLVSMDPREYRILSNGAASNAIGSDEIDSISDRIQSDLSDGNYADAFETYIDRCEYYLDGHINGFPFNFGKNLIIALAIGLVVGLITVFVLKGQLKSVRKQERAHVYVKPNSMQLTVRNDIFLYRDVKRIKKETSKSSGSGSSRSVGGGSF